MKFMGLEEIITMWEKDAPLDKSELGAELLKIPTMHSKYVKQLQGHDLLAKAKFNAYTALRRDKRAYYSGVMTQDELAKRGLQPFLEATKTETKILAFIDSDPEVLNLKSVIDVHESAANLCREIIKVLHNRSYQIKTYIEWEIFTRGDK